MSLSSMDFGTDIRYPLILKHLPDDDRDTLIQYLEHLMEQMAEEEPCLYTGGFSGCVFENNI